MGLKISGLVKFTPNAVSATISSASYSGTSFNVSSQDSQPTGIIFNPTGTRMFITGDFNAAIFQYNLTTGFDISSASYSGNSFSVNSQDAIPTSCAFNSTGTKMFVLGFNSTDVHQYSLATGFDLSTASYDNISLNVGAQETGPTGLTFNPTGTRLFVTGQGTARVYQYNLTAGFDISTASYAGNNLSVSAQDSFPRSVVFNSTGARMFIVGLVSDQVHQYSLNTGFDLSTATYDNITLDVSGEETTPTGITLNASDTRLFVTGQDTDSVYEYIL